MIQYAMLRNISYVVLGSFLTFVLFPASLFAVGSSGIENASFSAKSLAQGNGVVAQADEPAAISYNPAGIVYLPGLQVQPTVNFLSIFTSFQSRTPERVEDEHSTGTIVPVPTGYIVDEAGDSQEALESLKTSLPDLILMDLQLPGLDGYSVTKIIKQDASTKNIPIVALTAYAMSGDAERARAAGCDGYITKPIDPDEFPKVVAGYLKGRAR